MSWPILTVVDTPPNPEIPAQDCLSFPITVVWIYGSQKKKISLTHGVNVNQWTGCIHIKDNLRLKKIVNNLATYLFLELSVVLPLYLTLLLLKWWPWISPNLCLYINSNASSKLSWAYRRQFSVRQLIYHSTGSVSSRAFPFHTVMWCHAACLVWFPLLS